MATVLVSFLIVFIMMRLDLSLMYFPYLSESTTLGTAIPPAKAVTTETQFATNYRAILERIKRESNVKIVIIAPFLLDAHCKDMLL